MICPVEIARDMSALRAVRIRDHAEHGDLSEGRDGAGDESTGCDVAGDGEEDHLVAGGGDTGHQRGAPGAGLRAWAGRRRPGARPAYFGKQSARPRLSLGEAAAATSPSSGLA